MWSEITTQGRVGAQQIHFENKQEVGLGGITKQEVGVQKGT